MDMIDIVIIGAGPAGMSAAINAKALGKKPMIFFNESSILKKAENVNNHLGFVYITGADLIGKFESHIKECNIPIIKGLVSSIVYFDNKFMINVESKIYQAKSVILALGVPKNKEIKSEKDFLGKGVSYCAACDGMIYKNKEVIAWGIQENSYKEANILDEMGVKVTLVTNNKFDDKINKNIKLEKGTITAISGKERLEQVCINNTWVKTNALFIFRPSVPVNSLISGLEMHGKFIKTDKNMQTNLKGVFAAGDCTGKPFQISKAVGEGQVAAHSAVEFLNN